MMLRAAVLAAAFALAVPAAVLPSAALAQSSPPNPFTYSCADFLAAESDQQRLVANLMVYWSVGYLLGRLEGIEALQLDGEHHDRAVNDVVAALRQICPNVPAMAVAEFIGNLAGDIEKSAAQ